jgi:hypothetical protein
MSDLHWTTGERPVNTALSDFFGSVQAAKVGEVLRVEGNQLLPRLVKPSINIGVPTFDFGPSFHASIPQALYDRMAGQSVILPYDTCILLFRRPPDVEHQGPHPLMDHVVTYLTVARGGFDVRAFSRDSTHGIWYEQPFVCWTPYGPISRDMEIKITVRGVPGIKPKQQEYLDMAASINKLVVQGLFALSQPLSVKSRQEADIRMPKRLLFNVPPQKRPGGVIMLEIDNEVLARPVKPVKPTGRVMPPHDRRAHFRTLRDGRRIPVGVGYIHGGAPKPQHYRTEK